MSATSEMMVSRESGIMIPETGRAIRLVSRKCFGKVPKYRYASGPVVSWHAMDIAAEFHIHPKDEGMIPLFSVFCGHILFMCGYIHAIPAMAA